MTVLVTYCCITKHPKSNSLKKKTMNTYYLTVFVGQEFRSGLVESCWPRVSPDIVKMLTRELRLLEGSPEVGTSDSKKAQPQGWHVTAGSWQEALVTHHMDFYIGAVNVLVPWEWVASSKASDPWDHGRSHNVFHGLALEVTLYRFCYIFLISRSALFHGVEGDL